MNKVLLIDVVGLTPGMLGDDTPNISSVAKEGFSAPLGGVFPAVTCSAQSSMLTGRLPRDHGIVGNGWYFRDLCEVWLWRQSNKLVDGEKIWDMGRRRDDAFTAANMFWWYNMYSTVDWSMTPRPLYFADGRKMPGSYGAPPDFRALFDERMPTFPLFNFWGPTADIRSSDWIIDATVLAMKERDPTLTLAYVPHLDYDLQRLGPDDPAIRAQVRAVDASVGRLIDHARATDRRIVVVSEYGISAVTDAVHINRVLRAHGWLATTPILHMENLDPGASQAFAVADHQVAHVYVADPALVPTVKAALDEVDGIERVLDRSEQTEFGIEHERAGELVALSAKDRWFSYYFWEDDAKAPDYARTVDIHRKPGYDPVELFLDPEIKLAKPRIVGKLIRKKLGFRTLMDVIPLDTSLVRGSHGRLPDDPDEGAVIVSSVPCDEAASLGMTHLPKLVLDMVFRA